MGPVLICPGGQCPTGAGESATRTANRHEAETGRGGASEGIGEGAGDVERMIDQWLHPFENRFVCAAPGMGVERRLILPPRMDMEQERVRIER